MKEKETYIIIIIVLLVVGGLVFLNSNSQSKIDKCIDNAYDSYLTNWNQECNSRELGNNCSLPLVLKNQLDDSYENDKDRCVERYK